MNRTIAVLLLLVLGLSFAPKASAQSTCEEPVRVVTYSDSDQLLVLPVGGCFLLDLGGSYNWAVTVDEPAILACDSSPLAPGQQGVCTLQGGDSAEVTAVGTPVCYPSCLSPTRVFHLLVVAFVLTS